MEGKQRKYFNFNINFSKFNFENQVKNLTEELNSRVQCEINNVDLISECYADCDA